MLNAGGSVPSHDVSTGIRPLIETVVRKLCLLIHADQVRPAHTRSRPITSLEEDGWYVLGLRILQPPARRCAHSS